MTATLILSSLGGILAFLALIGVIVRGIFRIVNATEDNTSATVKLTSELDKVISQLNDHESRLGIVEDRTKRHGNS